MSFAPITLFVYNRPTHTKRTLDALALNLEAPESELYIFCDGPKPNDNIENLKKISEVVGLAKKENRFKKVYVQISKKNKGLAESIIYGVTTIVEKYGRVIVLEDDIETSKGFLKYMNDALSLYENNDEVMHISGYMYPHKEVLQETFFFNVPLCWGWATWKKSWKYFNNNPIQLWNELKQKNLLSDLDKFGGNYLSSQLAYNITGKLDTWFIKWHASVLLQNGFTLFPKTSLVQNFGFDNTGVHNGVHTEFHNSVLAEKIAVNSIAFFEDMKVETVIKDFYKVLNHRYEKKTLKKNIKDKIRNLVFLMFPDLKRVLKYNQKNNHVESYFGNNIKIYPASRISNTIIGNYTYISENSVINNTIIGKFCSIGANFMAGRGIHPTNGISTHPMFYSKNKQNGITLTLKNKTNEFMPITIGSDVFIGMNVTVLDGITIGDGAIIGAGAVVSKNIPAYAIAVGNPIKVINYRFEDEIISKLLKTQWWNLKHEDLTLVEKYFFNIEEFIKIFEEKIEEQ
ncbi:DapH/DapD/GlmU-related protein [Mariniflexile gromovii]|uniref:Glycosyl transferase family 2 n=1 Tax=Mariniflexile gromovii TaxID=362523 RepID=A0ABS4BVB5_9FLAO|nr:DapH/DapD/GlmU-related protein [Mariniflexile gromovii]MBP0904520.1 hypothetical protein [Mariniflexile gromovii]